MGDFTRWNETKIGKSVRPFFFQRPLAYGLAPFMQKEVKVRKLIFVWFAHKQVPQLRA